MNLLINLLLGFFVLVSVLMVLVILMQRPKSEGLGAAFGGGVTENIFGAQTTNVLVKFTTWLAGSDFARCFRRAGFRRGRFARRERIASLNRPTKSETVTPYRLLAVLTGGVCASDKAPAAFGRCGFFWRIIVGDSLRKRLNR
jgi:preprotein translocase subunit SecG